VKNIGRDILALGKALGVSNEVLARGSSIARSPRTMSGTRSRGARGDQNEVKNAMEKMRDDDLVILISSADGFAHRNRGRSHLQQLLRRDRQA